MTELIWKGKCNFTRHGNVNQPAVEITSPSDSPRLYNLKNFDEQPGEVQPDTTDPSTPDWHNRLIWGDKKDVLPALLPEFAEQIDLIYIDPPFMTGHNLKSGTQLAYSDKWGNNLDAYLQWLYETFVLLRLLLAPKGSLYVHLDWHAIHYAKVILD